MGSICSPVRFTCHRATKASVQFSCSVMFNSLLPHGLSTPGFPVLNQLLDLAQTPVHWVSDATQPSHPLSSPSPPAIFPSTRVSSNKSVLHIRWPKYWSFSFSSSPSKEHPGLLSSRMDWLHLLAVQGILNILLQQHSSKASNLWCSAFFIAQLSHPFMTSGKTIALTRWTFVGKVMSLLFNMLSRLVINFLPRNKCLLISWLQSSSAVILEPRKIKPATVSTVSPSICPPWNDGTRCHDLSECWALSQLFHSPLSLSSRGSLVLLNFLP